MDRHRWMYDISGVSAEYIRGVEEFIRCALKHQKKQRENGERDMISCPCRQCYNLKMCTSIEKLRVHLFRHGFKHGYTNWYWLGEELNSKRTSNRKYETEGNSMPNKAGKRQEVDKHPLSPGKGVYAAKRSKWVVDDPIASLSMSESSDSSTTSDARTGCGYNWVREQGKEKEGDCYIPAKYTGEVFERVGSLQEKVSKGSRSPHGHHDQLKQIVYTKQ